MACYAVSLMRQYQPLHLTAGRIPYTAGLTFLMMHLLAAFGRVHGWEHAAAWQHVRERTAATTGVESGVGLLLNELTVVVWLLDVAWWWLRPESRQARPKWVAQSISGLLCFMAFNATIVFARPATRIVAFVALGLTFVIFLKFGWTVHRSA